MSTQNSTFLTLDKVHKIYTIKTMFGPTKTVNALQDISFSLRKGEALALVGESGSGKSTCGRAIAGMFQIDSGEIKVDGKAIRTAHTSKEKRDTARKVQMVFQDPFASLNPTHTVRHHLERPLKLHNRVPAGKSLEDELHRTLSDVELDPAATLDKFPHELSGGQRQRINLARALAVGAELIIADEPTSMLDVSIRRSILNLMKRLKTERGITFLYITHDLATAHYLTENTAVMFGGRIVEYGPSDKIVRDPKHAYSKLLLSSVPNAKTKIDADFERAKDFSNFADQIRKTTAASTAELAQIGEGRMMRS
ncbi:ABC transporter ATP-binding protein [Maritalea sp.]|uniref:ABC transporter ATP-binding protein n=1 Tax=Maritalea sp. TaxID=2003361 RepID=UPI003EF1CA7D